MMKPLLLAIALTLSAMPVAGAQQPMTIEQNGGSRPIPDPTVLTTAAQERSIAALRELLDSRFRAIEEEIKQTKITLEFQDARAVKRLDDIPGQIDIAITHLQRLIEEKFKGVDQQFAGRDVALAAALLAQKTSVDEQNKANAASSAKAEGATTKQIDGIQSIITANSKATDDKLDGVKALLASQAKGVDDKIGDLRNAFNDLRTASRVSETASSSHSAGQYDLWAYIVGGGGLLVGILAFFIPRAEAARPYPPPNYPPNYSGYAPPPPPQVSVVPVVPVNVSPN